MNVLLDTHLILWSLKNDPALSDKALDIITDPDNDIYYSSASTWEVMIKHLLKPDELRIDGTKMAEGCRSMNFKMLPVTDFHVSCLPTLKYHCPEGEKEHKDPFDRMLLAQAKAEHLFLLTHDSKIPNYQESCVIRV